MLYGVRSIWNEVSESFFLFFFFFFHHIIFRFLFRLAGLLLQQAKPVEIWIYLFLFLMIWGHELFARSNARHNPLTTNFSVQHSRWR